MSFYCQNIFSLESLGFSKYVIVKWTFFPYQQLWRNVLNLNFWKSISLMNHVNGISAIAMTCCSVLGKKRSQGKKRAFRLLKLASQRWRVGGSVAKTCSSFSLSLCFSPTSPASSLTPFSCTWTQHLQMFFPHRFLYLLTFKASFAAALYYMTCVSLSFYWLLLSYTFVFSFIISWVRTLEYN